MLAEFFEALQQQAAQAHELKLVPIPGDPRRVLLVQGGNRELFALENPVLKRTILSFVDFLNAADRANDDGQAVEVYHDDKAIVLLHDRKDRHDRTTMPLQTSERWAAVLKLGEGFVGTQKEAIHFLRFGLGLDRLDPTLVGIRKLDFVRNSTGKNVAEHGRESLGRSVEMTVQQAEQIPEQFDVTVAPLASSGLQDLTVTVRVGVVLDLEGQRMIFRALPDEIARARNAWVLGVGVRLQEGGDYTVIHGSP